MMQRVDDEIVEAFERLTVEDRRDSTSPARASGTARATWTYLVNDNSVLGRLAQLRCSRRPARSPLRWPSSWRLYLPVTIATWSSASCGVRWLGQDRRHSLNCSPCVFAGGRREIDRQRDDEANCIGQSGPLPASNQCCTAGVSERSVVGRKMKRDDRPEDRT